jgi:hypothetical protein
LVPRVGRRQDSAPCTRGSACISLSEWRIHCHRGLTRSWAVLHLQLRSPPGGECRTILRDPLSAPRRRRDGRPVRCRDARIGPLPPSKGGPRHWQPEARGPRVRFSRLPASARRIGQAPRPGLPAWAAPVRASKRGCAVRSGLSQGPWQWPESTPFVRGLGEACAKGQRRPGCIGGFEERVADD